MTTLTITWPRALWVCFSLFVILSRWLVQQNITVVTAATEHEYIVEDLDVFSFTLTPTEMDALAAL